MADDSADAEPVEQTEADETAEADDETTADEKEPADDVPAVSRRRRLVATPTALGAVLLVALVALTGWLGYEFSQVKQDQQRREMFVDTARQAALNLTSVDWEHAEDDIQRVLDTSTGAFYDDFDKRSKSFLEVVKQIKSKSVGTVTASGLKSYSPDEAKVLVSATIRSTNAGVPEQKPQVWRMVLTVQDIDGKAKVSNVEFIQ
ncbi:Mce protein [Mycobacterium sp. GA-1841]|uniref:Mce protein n=1 Tax=Mycobacterium sp. GA-1841 TaxID=1834154 RepID=UPI00096C9061|nr:Mce protein [Mycobacterium sp. GA-1841]OMC35785.1 Mce protein [Mycobacterium sp. GA-1841]